LAVEGDSVVDPAGRNSQSSKTQGAYRECRDCWYLHWRRSFCCTRNWSSLCSHYENECLSYLSKELLLRIWEGNLWRRHSRQYQVFHVFQDAESDSSAH